MQCLEAQCTSIDAMKRGEKLCMIFSYLVLYVVAVYNVILPYMEGDHTAKCRHGDNGEFVHVIAAREVKSILMQLHVLI